MIYYGTSPFAFTYFLMEVAYTFLAVTIVAIIWCQSMIRKMEKELDDLESEDHEDPEEK